MLHTKQEAYAQNMHDAHEALVNAKHLLFAASWQVEGDASEVKALAEEVDAAVLKIHALRFPFRDASLNPTINSRDKQLNGKGRQKMPAQPPVLRTHGPLFAACGERRPRLSNAKIPTTAGPSPTSPTSASGTASSSPWNAEPTK